MATERDAKITALFFDLDVINEKIDRIQESADYLEGKVSAILAADDLWKQRKVITKKIAALGK